MWLIFFLFAHIINKKVDYKQLCIKIDASNTKKELSINFQ